MSVMRDGAKMASALLALAVILSPSTVAAQPASSLRLEDIDFWLQAERVIHSAAQVEPTSSMEPDKAVTQAEEAVKADEASKPVSEAADGEDLFEPAAVLTDSGDVLPESEGVAQLAEWVIAASDNGGLPFMVIDKVTATVFAFDAEGRPVGTTPALFGIARGDDATPGVGDRELSEIGPAEKTTPAGRYVAQIGYAKGKQKVLWVDYGTSVALHPVVTGNKKERRLERLESPTAEDNRITFGCINVPVPFFKDVVQPLFASSAGIVYVLPETKFMIEVFPAFVVQATHGRPAQAAF